MPDPNNPQSLNRYSWVRNNPLRYRDPTGYSEIEDWLIETGKKVGNSGPVGKALMVNASAVINHLNDQRQDIFFPDENTSFVDRLGACVEVGIEATVIGAVVAKAGTAIVAMGTAIFADGNPTNEAEAIAAGLEAVSADGDPTNEVQSAVRLYRAVSEAEFQQLMETGTFQTARSSVEGKYFATTMEHAAAWGEKLMGEGNFRVIQADLPAEAVAQFYFWEHLDGIGPAFFATMEQLKGVLTVIQEAVK